MITSGKGGRVSREVCSVRFGRVVSFGAISPEIRLQGLAPGAGRAISARGWGIAGIRRVAVFRDHPIRGLSVGALVGIRKGFMRARRVSRAASGVDGAEHPATPDTIEARPAPAREMRKKS